MDEVPEESHPKDTEAPAAPAETETEQVGPAILSDAREEAPTEALDAKEAKVEAVATPPAPEMDEEGTVSEKEAERNWYIVQTFAGQEERVKSKIEKTIKEMGMDNKIFSVLVPEEEVVEIKDGKRVTRMKKMYPGYVFIEMALDEASWYAIRQTPGVARFIGSKISPIPVTDREMKRVLKQLGMKEERLETFFEVGESIRIISGPFRGYTGTVDEINVQKSKIRSLVNIFGRDTPVEVNFDQAEKIT